MAITPLGSTCCRFRDKFEKEYEREEGVEASVPSLDGSGKLLPPDGIGALTDSVDFKY